MFTKGGHHIHTYSTIINSIEERYESLFEKEAYKYLDGKTVDKINSMSAAIFSLVSSASILKETPEAKSNTLLSPVAYSNETFDYLAKLIDALLNDLLTLRKSVDKL